MRNRSCRRDLEEQAERAVKFKLLDHGYDSGLITTLRCKETGRSIAEEVVLELSKNFSARKKLSSQFWMGVHVRFDLARAIFGDLPAIPESHEFPKDMEEAMAPAHAENPTERTVEPFLRYLDLGSETWQG